jgi:drug/metabolite transporter (DMT)-like permease
VLHERVSLMAWIGAFFVAGGLVLVVLAQNTS